MSDKDYFVMSYVTLGSSIKVSSKVIEWWGAMRGAKEGAEIVCIVNENMEAIKEQPPCWWYESRLIVHFWIRLMDRREFADQPLFFLDVGANTGSFTFLPLLDENIECAAYEPNKETYDILCENINLNELGDKIAAFNIGLWSENTQKQISIPHNRKDSGLSTLAENSVRFDAADNSEGYYTTLVECRTLDDHLAEEFPDRRVDAIKIDVEGADLYVLHGAEQMLRRDKPLVLVEFCEPNCKQFGYDREEILDFLSSLGYKKFSVVGTNPDPNEYGDLIAEWEDKL